VWELGRQGRHDASERGAPEGGPLASPPPPPSCADQLHAWRRGHQGRACGVETGFIGSIKSNLAALATDRCDGGRGALAMDRCVTGGGGGREQSTPPPSTAASVPPMDRVTDAATSSTS